MTKLENICNEYINKDRTKQFVWRGSPIYLKTLYRGLVDFVKSINIPEEKTILEIGTLFGESTELFAKCFKKVYTIDPHVSTGKCFWNGHGITMKEIQEKFLITISNYSNVEYINDYSYNVFNRFKNNSIDVLYVDGGHTYEDVKKDLILYIPKVKSNGYIGGHDYHPTIPGVIKAVDEICGKPNYIFEDSSWLCKKNN